MMKDRLRPSRNVSENFARRLQARRVKVITGQNVNLAPRCCAELYERWLGSGSELSALKLDTVADLAAETFKAEGGQLDEALTSASLDAMDPG